MAPKKTGKKAGKAGPRRTARKAAKKTAAKKKAVKKKAVKKKAVKKKAAAKKRPAAPGAKKKSARKGVTKKGTAAVSRRSKKSAGTSVAARSVVKTPGLTDDFAAPSSASAERDFLEEARQIAAEAVYDAEPAGAGPELEEVSWTLPASREAEPDSGEGEREFEVVAVTNRFAGAHDESEVVDGSRAESPVLSPASQQPPGRRDSEDFEGVIMTNRLAVEAPCETETPATDSRREESPALSPRDDSVPGRESGAIVVKQPHSGDPAGEATTEERESGARSSASDSTRPKSPPARAEGAFPGAFMKLLAEKTAPLLRHLKRLLDRVRSSFSGRDD